MQRFLLVGQTGVGKSSFVNATFGVQLAPIAAFEACTKVVEYYSEQTPYGEICLLDTPGLSEDTGETDEMYLRLMHDALVQTPVDFTLYITSLDETRFRRDEMNALQRLTTHLGTQIWENAWIVLTFAASVSRERIQEASVKRIGSIVAFLDEIITEGDYFSGFQRTILVDNVVANWHPDAVPIASALTFVND